MSPTEPLVQVHSRITSPLQQKSCLVQSLLFAELASASYYDESHAGQIARRMGFTGCQFFSKIGAQAYLFWNETDCVVACRGTEPNQWDDIKANANAVAVVTETFGRVHRGFKREVDHLWPMLEDALADNHRTLWFTGHSLGAAMATICAVRCYLSEIASMPRGLFTFGSPRVGDKRFVNFVPLEHLRWVNNNDIVTRVPPAWMGYCHGGREIYLNRNGDICDVSGWNRRLDRLRGFLRGLLRFQVDQFSDHSIDRYVECLLKAVQKASAEAQAEAGVEQQPADYTSKAA